ncbi:unnamed protein product, partial [Laminaria digitata]
VGGVGGADESVGGVRLDDLLAIAQDDPPGPVLVDARWQTSWHVPFRRPKNGLAIIVAQPVSIDTAKKLLSQAEQERARGADTCQAVVKVAKERHPQVRYLRDIPSETLEALLSLGTVRAQHSSSGQSNSNKHAPSAAVVAVSAATAATAAAAAAAVASAAASH